MAGYPPWGEFQRPRLGEGGKPTQSRRTGYWRWSATCAQPTAMPATADSGFLSLSLAVVAAMPIPGEPFLREGAFPRTPRVRAAEAINRTYPAQQSIEQSPAESHEARFAA